MKNDKEEELAEIDNALRELRSQEHGHLVEIAKLRGRVEAMRYFVSDNAAGRFQPNEVDRIIASERDRILQETARPSLADKDKELRRRQFILRSMNLQAEFTNLLERHRQQPSEVS